MSLNLITYKIVIKDIINLKLGINLGCLLALCFLLKLRTLCMAWN